MPNLETEKNEKAVDTNQDREFESIVVANAILDHARITAGENLTPMKLQKLLFLVHGALLGSGSGKLKGGFEAWPYGPVNRDVYLLYRHFGGDKIEKNVSEVFGASVPSIEAFEGHEDVMYFINSAYRVFGSWSGPQLSEFTHKTGSPWDVTVEKFRQEEGASPRPLDGVRISDNLIKDYFLAEILTAK